MKALDLYNQLEKDFVNPEITEDWYSFGMNVNDEFICDNFKQRSLGLLCDFVEEINKVYTAVFPSDKVIEKILADNVSDVLLFLHHPLDWDLSKNPDVAFYQINQDLLRKLKDRRISLFNFHLPLDNYGEYATTKTLAENLGITFEKKFGLLNGAYCGVIGTTEIKTVPELKQKYSQVVGHEVSLYQYGEAEILNGRVGVCAGGGNDTDIVTELIDNGINVLITGLSVKNKYSEEAHRLEEENRINLLAGTHYSSEKFACIAMCEYFKKLGLPAEFISDNPCLADL